MIVAIYHVSLILTTLCIVCFLQLNIESNKLQATTCINWQVVLLCIRQLQEIHGISINLPLPFLTDVPFGIAAQKNSIKIRGKYFWQCNYTLDLNLTEDFICYYRKLLKDVVTESCYIFGISEVEVVQIYFFHICYKLSALTSKNIRSNFIMKNKNSIQFWSKKFAEYHFGSFDFVKISQWKHELSAVVVIIDIIIRLVCGYSF